MTGPGLIGALAVLVGFGAATAILLPVVRRRRLGILHPAAVWLGLEAVFFGVGSIALAVGDGRPGPGLFLGACVLAAALGVGMADRIGPLAAGPVPPADPPDRPEPQTGPRRWVPAVLAIGAIALLLPTLVVTGLPLLSDDPTVARTALVGLPIQFVRVAIPGLAIVLLLDRLGSRPAIRHLVATGAVIVVLIGFLIGLASRYLVIELLAAIVLAWLLTGRSITLRTASIVILIGLGGFVAVGVLRAPEDFATDTGRTAVERTMSRLFLIQPRTLDALQTAIPDEEPYFLGLTWFRRIGPLFGRNDIPNLGYWIYPHVVDTAQDVAGYAAPGLIGEAWANFGPAGIALFVLFGVGLEGLAAWVAAHRARAVDIAAASLGILFVARTHALGLLGLGVLLALVLGWWLLAGARLHRTHVPALPDG